jgi:hypothetical protein
VASGFCAFAVHSRTSASFLDHLADGPRNLHGFLLFEVRMHWQRKDRLSKALADGEVTALITKESAYLLKVQRHRIVNTAADLRPCKSFAD